MWNDSGSCVAVRIWWWNDSDSEVGQIGFLMWNDSSSCVAVRILWQEHLQRWDSTDTEVEGPSEVE